MLALRMVYCLGPVVFYGLAMKLIWSYPLTPARHAAARTARTPQHAAGGVARVEFIAGVRKRAWSHPGRSGGLPVYPGCSLKWRSTAGPIVPACDSINQWPASNSISVKVLLK